MKLLPIPVWLGLRYAWSVRRGLSGFLALMSMAGLCLAVALLIVALSVMNGFDRELRERILAFMPHVALYQVGGIRDWQALASKVLKHQRVQAAAPFIQDQVALSRGDRLQTALLRYVLPEQEEQLAPLGRYVEGDGAQQLEEMERGLLLGQELADRLQVKPGSDLGVLALGPRSRGRGLIPAVERFKVAGTFATHSELDHTLALGRLATGAQLLGFGGAVQGLRLRLDDLYEAPQVAEELLQELGPNYDARTWVQTHGHLYESIQLSRRLVVVMLFAVVVVAAFNIVSTLIMVVGEKRPSIAVLRSMGASRHQVMMTFLVLGSWVGLLGSLLGLLLGLWLCANIAELMGLAESLLGIRFLDTEVYPVSYLPVQVLGSDLVWVLSVALAAALLASVYPARRAATLPPAADLRYE